MAGFAFSGSDSGQSLDSIASTPSAYRGVLGSEVRGDERGGSSDPGAMAALSDVAAGVREMVRRLETTTATHPSARRLAKEAGLYLDPPERVLALRR
jgi:hypothetical protein